MSMDDLELADEHYASEAKRYSRGRKIAAEIERLGIDPDNLFEIDSYFENTPPNWETDYIYYLEYTEKLKKEKLEKVNSSSTAINALETESIASPLVRDVLHKWHKHISYMAKSSLDEYIRMTNLFLKIIHEYSGKDNLTLYDLNLDMIEDYQEVIRNLPRGTVTKGRDANIHNLAAGDGVKRTASTINDNFKNVRTFFNWLKTKPYKKKFNEQVCTALDICDALSSLERVTEKDKRPIVPFSEDDLKKLFQSCKYQKGKFTRSADYWAPLIGLFTGARLSEIIQLNLSDIKENSGIMVFDFNEVDENGRLKTRQSRRLVPIHPQLKSLEFLKFVNTRRKAGCERVFPNEKRDSRDLFGDYSKRFATFRKRVEVGTDDDKFRKVFHSFRHLVRTELRKAEVETGLIDSIIGHASRERSIGEKVYTHTELVEWKYREIKKLKYDLDFSKIARWKNCETKRTSRRIRRNR